MHTIIKINITDLNEQIIQDLKEKYGNVELEIRVHSLQSKITKHQKVLSEYITELADERNNGIGRKLTHQAIIDTKNNHFQLVKLGWRKDRYIYKVLMHLDISPETGNIWVQQNNTEILIDRDLAKYDIPQKHFVAGFHPPSMREDTEFAVA